MTIVARNWIDVDLAGLAQILSRRGPGWPVMELVSNSWDTGGATEVSILLTPQQGQPIVRLLVEDNDPDGFKDLTHSFKLYAPSTSKGDAEKRGRFGAGCKMILALCTQATVTSTTGCYKFDHEGRHKLRTQRKEGSAFDGFLRMTRAELAEVEKAILLLIPPDGVKTTVRISGSEAFVLEERVPFVTIDATLPTEIADAEGSLRRYERKTRVKAYHTPRNSEGVLVRSALLYELGVPVMEIDGVFDLNVGQKVPQGIDREAAPPAFVRRLMSTVASLAHDAIPAAEFAEPWVAQAAADASASPALVDRYLDTKYGKKRVIHDLNEPEATREAVAAGYAPMYGGSESAAVWANVKKHGLAEVASQAFPQPKASDNFEEVPPGKQPAGYRSAALYVNELARRLLGLSVKTKVITSSTIAPAVWHSSINGMAQLTLNLTKLGPSWFKNGPGVVENDLLIHEMGHEAGDHLELAYHQLITKLGAQLIELALVDVPFFQRYRRIVPFDYSGLEASS